MNTQKLSFLNKKKPLLFKEAGVRPGPWLGLARFLGGKLVWLTKVPYFEYSRHIFKEQEIRKLPKLSALSIANISYNVKH